MRHAKGLPEMAGLVSPIPTANRSAHLASTPIGANPITPFAARMEDQQQPPALEETEKTEPTPGHVVALTPVRRSLRLSATPSSVGRSKSRGVRPLFVPGGTGADTPFPFAKRAAAQRPTLPLGGRVQLLANPHLDAPQVDDVMAADQ